MKQKVEYVKTKPGVGARKVAKVVNVEKHRFNQFCYTK